MPASDECFVDSNVIIEATRTASLPALVANRARLVTVDEVLKECATGRRMTGGYVQVDTAVLRRQCRVEPVTPVDSAELLLRLRGATDMDPGEKHLLAAALKTNPPWCICSPDKALIRACQACQCLDRVISLEELVEAIGHAPHPPLREAYTRAWLSRFRTELLLEAES